MPIFSIIGYIDAEYDYNRLISRRQAEIFTMDFLERI